MKRKLILVVLVFAVLFGAFAAFTACADETTGSFKAEYEIRSGESISIGGGVTYEIVGEYEGVSIDAKTGVITFDDSAPYTQILVVAKKDGKVVSETKVTLVSDFQTPTLTFTNLTDNIVDGETVTAVSDTGSAVTYELKESVSGISIGRTTGRVSFAASVEDGTAFTVVASSRGATAEHAFKASTENFVTAEETTQYTSLESPCDVGFKLDFASDETVAGQGVLGVQEGNSLLDESLYEYDAATRMLRLKKEAFASWTTGEHALKIVTAKNSVSVTVIAATKFINTAEDLASINDSAEALSGYYVMMSDIDLSAYCQAHAEEGYWEPIGVYHDVTDGTALADAFKGTFDGNGHKITGFHIYRDDVNDTTAFNAGLFGYIDTSAVIRNLGLESDEYNAARSYSGLFAGVNTGTIENCYVKGDFECIGNCTGGFVGRNEGTIENAYVLGDVIGEQMVGAFAGRNMGELINCYAVASDAGASPVSTLVGSEEGQASGQCFESQEAFESFDFPFGEPWVVGEGAPYLKEAVKTYYMNGIALTGIPETAYKGSDISLSAIVTPSGAVDAGELVYTASVGTISDGVLHLPYDTDASVCVVTVTCGEFSDSAEISLLDPAVTFGIESDTLVKATEYDLFVSVLPDTAELKGALKYQIVDDGGDSRITITSDGKITVSRNSKWTSVTVRAYVEIDGKVIAEVEKTFAIADPV